MKKKNGFISVSIVYTFFIVFLLLLILVITSYMNNRITLGIYKQDIKEYLVTPSNDFICKDKTASECIIYMKDELNYENIETDIHGDYKNYRFVGANPDNYACLSSNGIDCINYDKDDASNKPAGLFRIIGVFNEDTHGVSGKQLVKLISADILGNTKIRGDYKQTGIGSSTSDYGSNNWSDSQLMYMLNGFVNTGYNGTTQLHSGYSYNPSTYYISDGTYNIYKLNNGNSYLTGAGATILNEPEITTTSSYFVHPNTSMQTLTTTQENMIATVTWKLGGISNCGTSSKELVSQLYNYERGTIVPSGHTTTWSGKIGLMYLSDYGYATSGNPDDESYTRDTCLDYNLYSWYGPNGDKTKYCGCNSYLLYPGARNETQGTASTQWTISPMSSSENVVFNVGIAQSVYCVFAYTERGVRPSFYLESDVSLVSGTGTSTDPYVFVRN